MAKFVVTAKKDGKSTTRTVTADSKKAARKKVKDAGYEVEDIRSQDEGLEELGDGTASADEGEAEIISVEEVEDDGSSDDGGGDDEGSEDGEEGGEDGEEDGEGEGEEDGEGDEGSDGEEDEIEPEESHWWFK